LGSAENEVVVYTALDKEFSQPILDQVGSELALTVRPKFDVESNKTVGLVTDLIQHRKRPRADLFWNNEILHTIRLQQLGMLQAWTPPDTVATPDRFRATDGTWFGFAARARVFLVNTDLLPDSGQRPSSFYDLANPRWARKCGLAKPLFGTSATHAAVMFDRLGVQDASRWYQQFESNASIESGNRQVAVKVGRGELVFGLTDTDDAMLEIDRGSPVAIVYPDQGDSQIGTLLIPNTLCILRDGPNPARAKQLAQRLLEAEIEKTLAAGPSAQFPLNENITSVSRANPPRDLKTMGVDFESAAKQWTNVAAVLRNIFE
jgi:iron(III) transport system substrate-binding protein